jgi:hypothetical protein
MPGVMNFRPSRWGAVLCLSLVLGLGMPGPTAWAAKGKGARGASSARKAKARKGPQPKLLLPAEDAELEPGKVIFRWRTAAKLVRFQVARDEEFSDSVADKPVKGLQAALSLEPGTYYWRVTAPRGGPSDPRRLTVTGGEQPEPLAAAQPEQPPATEMGLGLDLTGASPATPSGPSPQELQAAEAAAAAEAERKAAAEAAAAAEAERKAAAQRGSQKRWSVFVGGSAAYGASAPNSMATLRYEASVGVRIANPLELSLGVGGTSLRVLGTRDATWPSYEWLGQYYFDLGARYRLARFEGAAVYGLVAGRLSFFTASLDQLGFLAAERGPFSAGAGLAFRFRAGLPMELGLRGNVLTGAKLGGELELGLRVLVF